MSVACEHARVEAPFGKQLNELWVVIADKSKDIVASEALIRDRSARAESDESTGAAAGHDETFR